MTLINEKLGFTHRTHPQLPWQLAVLGPGDSLVLPENWWHCVTSSAQSSVSVTTFVPHLLELPPPAHVYKQDGKVKSKSKQSMPYSATNGPRSSVGSAIAIESSSSNASSTGSQVRLCIFACTPYLLPTTPCAAHGMSMCVLGTARTCGGNNTYHWEHHGPCMGTERASWEQHARFLRTTPSHGNAKDLSWEQEMLAGNSHDLRWE